MVCKHLTIQMLGCVVLTTEVESPFGYGRIIYDSEGNIKFIKEEKDASETEKLIKEVNTGVFLFKGDMLWEYIDKLKPNNKVSELYITDIVFILQQAGHKVVALKIKDSQQFLGVNSPQELQSIEAEQTVKI